MRNKSFIYTKILLFLLLYSTHLFAQKKVEKLESDEDVVKFVKSYFSEDPEIASYWKRFSLIDGNEWKGLYNINKNVEDSLSNLKVNKWLKADFNFDKKEDIVICGKIPNNNGYEFVLLTFLSDEEGSYTVKSIVPEEYQSYPYYFSLINLPKINILGIRLVKWFPDINNESKQGFPFTIDTLGFAQNYVVNYNAGPDSLSFKSIRFETASFNGEKTTVSIFNLNKGSSANFNLVKYGKKSDSTVVHGKITMDIYSELLALINYSGFSNLPNTFQSNSNADGTFTLDVSYANNSEKKVQDFSGGGTYTLAAIYQWFDWLIDYSNKSIFMRKVERQKQY